MWRLRWLSLLIFLGLVLKGRLCVYASADSFALPQIVVKGPMETFFDQGLIRRKGQVVDYWRNFDNNLIRIKKLHIDTAQGRKTFDVIIVIQREGDLRALGELTDASTSASLGFVPNLFRWVRRFAFKEYADQSGAKVLKRLGEERDFYNGVSAMVVVTAENDISDIKALLRVVRRGNLPANSLLDVEQIYGAQPAVPIEFRTLDGEDIAVGDLAEAKTYLKARELSALKINLTPYLMATLHQFKLYEYGQRYMMKDGKLIPWAASHLILEADVPLARLYSKPLFGFKVLRETEDHFFIMTSRVDDFLKSQQRVIDEGDQNIRTFVATPPISGWNYLPVMTPEIDEFYKRHAGSKFFPHSNDGRVHFYSMSDESRIRSTQEEADSEGSPPQVFHPFDPAKRLGLSFYEMTQRKFRPKLQAHPSFASNAAYETYIKELGRVEDEWSWKRRWKQNELKSFYEFLVSRGFADPQHDPEAPVKDRAERLKWVLKDPGSYLADVPHAVRYAIEKRAEDSTLDKLLVEALVQMNDVRTRVRYQLGRHQNTQAISASMNINMDDYLNQIEAAIVESMEGSPSMHQEVRLAYETWAQRRVLEDAALSRDFQWHSSPYSRHLRQHPEMIPCIRALQDAGRRIRNAE